MSNDTTSTGKKEDKKSEAKPVKGVPPKPPGTPVKPGNGLPNKDEPLKE